MSRLRLDNFTHLLIIGGNDNKKLSIPTKKPLEHSNNTTAMFKRIKKRNASVRFTF